ncbi:MAG: hypothetical protein AAF290_00070 [Pseudomonadota bacterium]
MRAISAILLALVSGAAAASIAHGWGEWSLDLGLKACTLTRHHSRAQLKVEAADDIFEQGVVDDLQVRISYLAYTIGSGSGLLAEFSDNAYVLVKARQPEESWIDTELKIDEFEFIFDPELSKRGFFVFVASFDATDSLLQAFSERKEMMMTIRLFDDQVFYIDFPMSGVAKFSSTRAVYETCKTEHAVK